MVENSYQHTNNFSFVNEKYVNICPKIELTITKGNWEASIDIVTLAKAVDKNSCIW
jgi:hypothetical protein